MKTVFSANGWEDYIYWQANDPGIIDEINDLIKEIKRDPFKGSGKPEPLKGNFAGFWSRRITREHRLVYTISGAGPEKMLIIIQARFHY